MSFGEYYKSFVLQIHYEHPVELIKGSYVILYDLNIIEYLSLETPDSTAYFNVYFNINYRDLQVYNAKPEHPPSMWQPKMFTSTSEGIAIDVKSKYGFDLPGDLVVSFSTDLNDYSKKPPLEPLFPARVIAVAIILVFVTVLLYAKRKAIAGFFEE